MSTFTLSFPPLKSSPPVKVSILMIGFTTVVLAGVGGVIIFALGDKGSFSNSPSFAPRSPSK
ncbi:hypothetical protein D3C87_1838560 [compost metagenome]